ncbi:DUF6960 family protein [Azotosporobacter soli]|uniref:DUF6960 family protein n=1 Tax=Azotosporobacter soli TaxID=3055040 RepID=UPI0031FEE8BB
MSRNKNTWGLYPWFIENGEQLIEPLDLEKFKRLSPYGKIFECIDEDNEYITLKYGEEVYQVKAELYKQVNAPIFTFGNKVRLTEKLETIGVIIDINWHNKENTPIYLIEINGKRKSTRYMETDLSMI